ncbi:MAG TPA: hypothetical protein VMS32_08035 [Verrucomicrobiae bacterium]|nr:hypothetical protein [Verrucomicrobiae bacterium]
MGQLACLAAVFTLLLPIAAGADDVGQHPDLRAIRAALPVLFATRLNALHVDRAAFQTTDVIVNDNEAIASWSDGPTKGIAILRRRSDLWWLTGEVDITVGNGVTYWQIGAPDGLPRCSRGTPRAPNDRELTQDFAVSTTLAKMAVEHIPAIGASTALANADPHYLLVREPCLDYAADLGNMEDGYVTFFRPPSPAHATIIFHGRAPTLAEMLPTPGANAYYFFTITNAAPSVLRVDAGAALDVWCPFVLDPSLRYGMSLGFSDPTIKPVDGTLKDNVLHFTLPAFSAGPGVEMMGEIDGNP